ncbi:MAG: lactate/malate family dehydrogenase [Candidatus Bathyarchaeales archaeon]
MHIAQIGVGRVGRPTAYSIMCCGLADEITVCDVKPGLAEAFAEELKHASVSLGLDVGINACERDEEVSGADIILISAGKPRTPGVNMSRRDLAVQNAEIVKFIAETTSSRNKGAKYIVITNPVDAMAMVCKRHSKADFVISTGTNLESLRFRSKLAEVFAVPRSNVQGWVGGEHGEEAALLWSTVKINGLPFEGYTKISDKVADKEKVASYVKTISKTIVDNIGGTEYGPAASFRDIVRAIVNNICEFLSVAAPMKIEGIPEPVFVSVPRRLGKEIGFSIYNELPESEKQEIIKAANTIYQTFLTVTGGL